MLRQAEIVRWLAGSAAQQSNGSGGDPSALLHRLQLGHAGASSGAGSQVPPPLSATSPVLSLAAAAAMCSLASERQQCMAESSLCSPTRCCDDKAVGL